MLLSTKTISGIQEFYLAKTIPMSAKFTLPFSQHLLSTQLGWTEPGVPGREKSHLELTDGWLKE